MNQHVTDVMIGTGEVRRSMRLENFKCIATDAGKRSSATSVTLDDKSVHDDKHFENLLK